jgi:hypothetical protein
MQSGEAHEGRFGPSNSSHKRGQKNFRENFQEGFQEIFEESF